MVQNHISQILRFMSEDQKKLLSSEIENKPSLENQTYLKYYLQQWFTGPFKDNVLFRKDFTQKRQETTKVSKKYQLSGLIDFYFAGTDVLCYDLAVTLNDWAISKTKTFGTSKNYFDKMISG
ncbi:MAG: hypothetical protein CM15mP58_01090 [Burkholderiaceae bacterium]|nr:MAG: hypothetical protein CM15mP58_01090 [Burkholderiaceae bacterium]